MAKGGAAVTKDDALKAAKARFRYFSGEDPDGMTMKSFETTALMVYEQAVAAERERCAKIATLMMVDPRDALTRIDASWNGACLRISESIRSGEPS